MIFGTVPKLASVPCFDFPFNLLCQGKIELVSGCGEGNVLYTVQACRRLLVFQGLDGGVKTEMAAIKLRSKIDVFQCAVLLAGLVRKRILSSVGAW